MADRNAARRSGASARRPEKAKSLESVPGVEQTPEKFDRLVHERIRLGMLSALAVNKSLSFTELKQLLNATDGNLSVHLRARVIGVGGPALGLAARHLTEHLDRAAGSVHRDRASHVGGVHCVAPRVGRARDSAGEREGLLVGEVR